MLITQIIETSFSQIPHPRYTNIFMFTPAASRIVTFYNSRMTTENQHQGIMVSFVKPDARSTHIESMPVALGRLQGGCAALSVLESANSALQSTFPRSVLRRGSTVKDESTMPMKLTQAITDSTRLHYRDHSVLSPIGIGSTCPAITPADSSAR